MSGNLLVTVVLVGSPSGPEVLQVPFPVAGSILNDTEPLSFNDSVSVPIPAGASYLHFTPPAGNQIRYYLGGIEGHLTAPSLISLDTAAGETQVSISTIPRFQNLNNCELRWY